VLVRVNHVPAVRTHFHAHIAPEDVAHVRRMAAKARPIRQ
jgi:hypothetical protein